MPDEQAPDPRRMNIALGGLVALVVCFGLMFAMVAYVFWRRGERAASANTFGVAALAPP